MDVNTPRMPRDGHEERRPRSFTVSAAPRRPVLQGEPHVVGQDNDAGRVPRRICELVDLAPGVIVVVSAALPRWAPDRATACACRSRWSGRKSPRCSPRRWGPR